MMKQASFDVNYYISRTALAAIIYYRAARVVDFATRLFLRQRFPPGYHISFIDDAASFSHTSLRR